MQYNGWRLNRTRKGWIHAAVGIRMGSIAAASARDALRCGGRRHATATGCGRMGTGIGRGHPLGRADVVYPAGLPALVLLQTTESVREYLQKMSGKTPKRRATSVKKTETQSQPDGK